MRVSEEQTSAIKEEFHKAVGTLSAEQVLRVCGVCFTVGMIVAEGLLNRRTRAVEARERLSGGKGKKP